MGYFEWHEQPGYFRDVTRHFAPGAELLDLGCGTGWMAEHFSRYTGLDGSPDAVAQAAAKGRDVRLHDLFSILAYFGGYGVEARNKRMMEPRAKEAEAIARQGKVWTEKVLRKEDMEVYMFRLLLEWGRLTDDRRTEIGFRMGRGRGRGEV